MSQRATVIEKPPVPRRWLSKQLRNDLRAYVFLAPWLVGLLVFTAYPTLATFYYSFTRYNILKAPQWIGTANFSKMFTGDPLYWQAVENTVSYALAAVPLGLLLALGLAVLLNQRSRGIGFYRTVFYLPSLVPVAALSLIWMLILDPHGLLNSVLVPLGVSRPGWFRSAEWSKPGLIIMSLWAGSGTAMLIFLAGLKDTPQALLEAATLDGANGWQRFRYVTLPLLTPTIFFNLIIGIINSFQVFGQVFIIGGQQGNAVGPLNSMLMYMIQIYRYAFKFFDMGYASAMALVLFLVLLALAVILNRTSRYWVHYEGEQRA